MDRLVVSRDNNRPARTYFSRRGSFRQECPTNREFPSKASPSSHGEVGLSRIWGESGEQYAHQWECVQLGWLAFSPSRVRVLMRLARSSVLTFRGLQRQSAGEAAVAPFVVAPLTAKATSLLRKRKTNGLGEGQPFGILPWGGSGIAAVDQWVGGCLQDVGTGGDRAPATKISHPQLGQHPTSNLQPEHGQLVTGIQNQHSTHRNLKHELSGCRVRDLRIYHAISSSGT